MQVYGSVFESSSWNIGYCPWFAYILENSDLRRPK